MLGAAIETNTEGNQELSAEIEILNGKLTKLDANGNQTET